jgi:L-threonylcarbamoyladenylate synthase
MASHYAPRARVELVAAADRRSRLQHLLDRQEKVAVIELAGDEPLHATDANQSAAQPMFTRITLGAQWDECARRLYAGLREVDEAGCDVVLITLPPATGLAAAIADRLLKAAGLGN